MTLQQLEIVRVGESERVSRRLRCLAGKITVFRSNRPEEIFFYVNAFAGRAGGEVSISVDESPFDPASHNLVGFGERFDPNDSRSVAVFLTSTGVSAGEVEKVLLANGLGGLAAQKIGTLDAGEERTLRLIAATRHPEQVLVLNDPFDPIPETWREKVARLIADFAWKHRGLVVVPSLSWRPEHWIENEVISKILLDRARARTIGFNMGGDETRDLVQALRQEMKSEAVRVSSEAVRVSTQAAAAEVARSSSRLQWRYLAGGGIAALLSALLVVWTGGEEAVESAQTTPPVEELTAPDSLAALPSGAVVAAVQVEPTIPPVPTATPRPPNVLEGYPSEVQGAVMLAFNDPAAAIRARAGAAPAKPVRPVVQRVRTATENIFADIPSGPDSPAADSSSGAPAGAPSSPEEAAARREEIRRKFLEMIARHQEQR